jgi:hypothetical protein
MLRGMVAIPAALLVLLLWRMQKRPDRPGA